MNIASIVPSALDSRAQRSSWPARVELLGMPLHPVRFDQAVDLLLELAHGDRPAYAVTANVDHVVRVSHRPELRSLYAHADLAVADGMPLIWASRILRRPLPERVAGSDLFPALCAKAAEQDLSVFLLGGAPAAEKSEPLRCGTWMCSNPCVARRAADVLQAKHPRLRIAGTYCPEYRFEEDPLKAARAVGAVREAKPDILFVALGSPKQERWIVSNLVACGATLSIGVGISFGFVAGDVARAPRWMQRAGLEWFHRLCQEPSRLWRRYLVEDPRIALLVARDLFRRGRPMQNETPPS